MLCGQCWLDTGNPFNSECNHAEYEPFAKGKIMTTTEPKKKRGRPRKNPETTTQKTPPQKAKRKTKAPPRKIDAAVAALPSVEEMVTTEATKLGRPTAYCEPLIEIICFRLSIGESLKTICKDSDMPNAATVYLWLQKYPEFYEKYSKAKALCSDYWCDEILEISDDGTNDWVETHDPDNPGYRFSGEHFQRSRLRVDSRKWLMSKLMPKRFGDKVINENTGNLGVSIQRKIADDDADL